MGSELPPGALLEYALAALGVRGAHTDAAVLLAGGERVDFLVTADGQTFLIEVNGSLPTKEVVAHLALLRALHEHAHPGRPVVPVLITKSAPPRVRDLLERIGSVLIEAPPGLLPAVKAAKGITPLTTDKAWKVLTTLLRQRAVKGIRALSQESGVSAGWVHRTVNELEARGIARKGAEGILMDDSTQILDIVPFERPFKSLETEIIATDYANAHEAAVEITRLLSRDRPHAGPIAFAFGGHTAAGLHTGYAHRQDRVDLYVADPDFRAHIDAPADATGVRVHIFKPDRDIVATSQVIEDVRVVSRELALLDMAGLGYAGRDVALKLLDSYGGRQRT